MLTEGGIPHELVRLFDGWQVWYPSKDGAVADAVEHYGSYGRKQDLIEIMGLLTPDERSRDGVLGSLTAEDVFKRFRDHYLSQL